MVGGQSRRLNTNIGLDACGISQTMRFVLDGMAWHGMHPKPRLEVPSEADGGADE